MVESFAREFLSCPSCGRDGLSTVPFSYANGEVADGVLACGDCRAWYRIEEGLPEILLPALRDESRRRAFRERFRGRWDGWEAEGSPAVPDPNLALKREQVEFFRSRAAAYDRGMADSPFWRAVDGRFLDVLDSERPRGGFLVEAGAGTGRRTAELSARFAEVLAFDLSEEMTREALHKGSGPGRVHRFVADAERVPLRAGLADCWAFRGVLAYLDSPGKAVAEAARVLRSGGVLLGYENNRSALRPAFDLLMRFLPGWAGKSFPERATIGLAELEGWLEVAGIGIGDRVRTGVFLPPQFLNLAGPVVASGLMRLSDAALGTVPWMSRQGGLVFFAGRKGKLGA